MHVHAVGVQGDVAGIDLPVVDRHQHEVDVRLRPDRVVRQAAAENDGEDRPIPLDLLDQIVERGREPLMDRSAHGPAKDNVVGQHVPEP